MRPMLIVAAATVALTAVSAIAQQAVDPERRALFLSILEENDCKMSNLFPAQGILDAFEANGFDRDEVRAIGQDLLRTGDGVREGETMVVKTENCT